MAKNDDRRELASEHGRLHAAAVYEVIRQAGDDELRRPLKSLWWSGVAAGIAMTTSLVAEGLLHEALPEAHWRHAVASLGYTMGFVIVVLGRLQLFTENTITAVLPCMARFSRENLVLTSRLWGIVFSANMAGALAAVGLATLGGFASTDQLDAYLAISRPLFDNGWWEMLVRGIPAGFYVAAMVWLLPSSKGFEIWVILLLTYLIALGDFSHIIAGAVEAFLLMFVGEVGVLTVVFGFIVPVFIGNVIGGTALFSLLAYAQVAEEIEE